jgi:hypothetical protein
MRNKTMTSLARQIAISTIVVALLGGCAQTKDWMSSMRGSRSSSDDTTILGAPDAEYYLDDLYKLTTGDPATQAEIFADAESGFRLTPGLQTNLRFALVLATAGHPETNPEQAQTILQELLTQAPLLTSAELSLATINLNSVEQQIALTSEAQRLRVSDSQAARTESASTDQRLDNAEAENRRLRQDLDDAEAKLEAISSIERSIRAQEQ